MHWVTDDDRIGRRPLLAFEAKHERHDSAWCALISRSHAWDDGRERRMIGVSSVSCGSNFSASRM